MKVCNSCNQEKEVSEFYLDRNSPRGRCKACYSSYQKEQRIKHIDKRQKYDKDRDSGSKRQSYEGRNKQALKKYGLTKEQYVILQKDQNNKCAICGEEESIIKRGRTARLAVDHCHLTDKIRSLLCNRCNLLLGKAHDNPDILLSAAAYLRNHQSEFSLDGVKTAYLAGPMSGYPLHNFPAFYAAAEKLESLNLKVINPAKIDEENGFDPQNPGNPIGEELRNVIWRDISGVLNSDAVVVLPGWERSVGAQAEVAVAKWMGKKLIPFTSIDIT